MAAVLGVDEAAAALQELVAVSVAGGLVTEEVGFEVVEAGSKATEEYAKGDLNKALEHLDHADADVETALSAGAFASPDVAVSLHTAIDALRGAMLAEPPVEEPMDEGEDEGEDEGGEEEGDGESEDSGPGNSENAPGKQKKEKDDD